MSQDELASDERTELDHAAPKHQSASAQPEPEGGSTDRKRRRVRRARRHPDIETARLLVKCGLVTKQAAVETLRAQKSRAQSGKERLPLLKLLVKRGALSPDDLDEARDEVRRHTYICDTCFAQAVVLAGSQTRAGACPRCGNEIAVEQGSAGAVPAREFSGSRTEAFMPMDAHGEPEQRVFGRYQLMEELGRGAMGVVYRARHTQLGKDVALKLLLPTQESWEMQVARFRREAAAVQKLRHPGIIAVHDFGFEGRAYYLTMDLVEDGEPFHALLKEPERAPPLARRLELLVKVCQAVGHAHQRGVIHRDLKPANVLLTGAGEPLVVDFGLAKDEDEEGELTRTHDRLGTPLFMAPEQIRKGAAGADYRVDIWALGVMLFVCVTGRYPFRSRTVMDLYLRIMREPPDWTGNLYSAPDRAGIMQVERESGGPAHDPFAETASELMASDEQTEVSSRTGPTGELPTRLPPPGRKVPVGHPAPAPFAPPPDLKGEAIPRDLRAIIECALNKDPDDRYVAAEDLAFDLQRFLDGKPVLYARRPNVWRRLRLALRRRKVLIPLAAVLVVAVIALTALAGAQVYLRSNEQRAADLKVALATDRDWTGYGKLDEELTRLVKTYGVDAELLYHRAVARLRRFNLDEAEADLDQAGAAEPTPALREAIARERTLIEIMRGNYAGAQRSGRAALRARKAPTVESALCFARGVFAAPDPDPAALDELETVCTQLVLEPGAPPELVALHVRLALLRGDLDQAAARLPERSSREPFELLLVRGALALAEGDATAAEQDFRYARSAWRPESRRYGQLSGDLAYFDDEGYQRKLAGDFEQALLSNKAAAALSPFHGRPHYWIGRLILTQRAEVEAALPSLRLAGRLDPYDADAFDLLHAALTARRGRLDESLDHLAQAEACRPGDPEPLLLQAYQRLRRGEIDAAREAVARAATACEGAEPRTRLARAALLLLEGGEPAEALALEEGYAAEYRTELEPVDWMHEQARLQRPLRDAVELGRVYVEHDRPTDALRLLAPITAREGELSANRDSSVTRHLFAAACLLECRARLRLRHATSAEREREEARALELLGKAVWKMRRRDDEALRRRDPLSPWLTLDALRGYPELQGIQDRPEFQAVLDELRQEGS